MLIGIAVVAAFGIFFGYSYFAAFYRASAREIKRLGVLLSVLCPKRQSSRIISRLYAALTALRPFCGVAHRLADDTQLRRDPPVLGGEHVLH